MDKEHKETDKMLAGLELALKKMYSKKFIELKKEVREVMSEIDLDKSLTPIERYQKAQKYDRLKKIEKKFAEQLNEVNKEAVKVVNNKMFEVYKTNYSAGLDNLAVLLAITIPNKYDKVPTNAEIKKEEQSPLNEIALDDIKDLYELRKNVNRQFITAIMKGENVNDIIKRLQKTTELKLSDITRIARTQTTRLENMARQDVCDLAVKMGYKTYKRWDTKIDGKERDAHAKVNGTIIEADKTFVVDGEKMMFPGDITFGASAGNVINCRCSMSIGIIKNGAFKTLLKIRGKNS